MIMKKLLPAVFLLASAGPSPDDVPKMPTKEKQELVFICTGYADSQDKYVVSDGYVYEEDPIMLEGYAAFTYKITEINELGLIAINQFLRKRFNEKLHADEIEFYVSMITIRQRRLMGGDTAGYEFRQVHVTNPELNLIGSCIKA